MLVQQAKASAPSAMGPVRVCLSLSRRNPRQKRVVSGQGRLAWAILSQLPGAKLVTPLLMPTKGIGTELRSKLSSFCHSVCASFFW